jgi:YfiR/HmsC-like
VPHIVQHGWKSLRSCLWVWTASATVLLTLSGQARAEKPDLTEYQVKAAFLFNFVKFVEWPAASFSRADEPLVIGVVGEDPFGDDLDRILRNKSINNRPLKLKRCQNGQNPTGCHLVFISQSEKARMPEIVRSLKGSSVLLVSELEGFLELGGMIRFYLDSNNVRFEINPRSAERAGLKISSKLLGVAKVVRVEANP